ncbi:MAG: hypothetical protein Q9210_006321, partial [Variospora velana]
MCRTKAIQSVCLGLGLFASLPDLLHLLSAEIGLAPLRVSEHLESNLDFAPSMGKNCIVRTRVDFGIAILVEL